MFSSFSPNPRMWKGVELDGCMALKSYFILLWNGIRTRHSKVAFLFKQLSFKKSTKPCKIITSQTFQKIAEKPS
jgi:hypothetical protein